MHVVVSERRLRGAERTAPPLPDFLLQVGGWAHEHTGCWEMALCGNLTIDVIIFFKHSTKLRRGDCDGLRA